MAFNMPRSNEMLAETTRVPFSVTGTKKGPTGQFRRNLTICNPFFDGSRHWQFLVLCPKAERLCGIGNQIVHFIGRRETAGNIGKLHSVSGTLFLMNRWTCSLRFLEINILAIQRVSDDSSIFSSPTAVIPAKAGTPLRLGSAPLVPAGSPPSRGRRAKARDKSRTSLQVGSISPANSCFFSASGFWSVRAKTAMPAITMAEPMAS